MVAQIGQEGSFKRKPAAVRCVGRTGRECRDVALSPRQLEAGRRPNRCRRQHGILTAAPLNNPGNAHTGNLGVIQHALRWRGVERLDGPKTRHSD